ncbi:MAG TPA: hypothetical protein VK991_01665 [Halomonas sp.]|nr:hypothetical protein [Halomonas sp.]
MPNPSIKISIAPSRLALGCHSLLGLALAVLVFALAGAWFAMLTLLLVWLVRVVWRAPAGQLKLEYHQRRPLWHWREAPSAGWCPVVLECDYLGPWLIGLKLSGRRLWVWPDSSDTASRRLLRRALVRLP